MGCAPSNRLHDAEQTKKDLRNVLDNAASRREGFTNVPLTSSAELVDWGPLQRIALPGVQLTDRDAFALGASLRYLHNLNQLDLRKVNLNRTGVEFLSIGMVAAKLSMLQVLWVGGMWSSEIGCDDCMRTFSTALIQSQACALTSLDFSVAMRPPGGVSLVEMVVALRPPLARLELGDTRFGGAGARALSDAHTKYGALSSLQHLDLFACHIGPWGAEAIARALSHELVELPIETLILGDNAIQDRGLSAIAAAIRANSTVLAARLQHLDLSGNGLGGDGQAACRAFAEALAEATVVGLRKLNLASNFLGTALVPIAELALPAMRSLVWLELGCNSLTDDALAALTSCFECRFATGIESLGLYHQPRVSDRAVARLLSSLHQGAPRLSVLHAAALNMSGEAGGAVECALSLLRRGSEASDNGSLTPLQRLDLRDNGPLEAALASQFEECRIRRPELELCCPGDAWVEDEDDVFAILNGVPSHGLLEHRSMVCEFVQSFWLVQGDDSGAELDQAPFYIQEPDGSINQASTATKRECQPMTIRLAASGRLDNTLGIVKEC